MNGAVAIIPARGGSKGIPRKNLVPVAGKPLVVHSIEHGLAARSIDRVIVSTDDPEIAEVSRRAGAEVLARPAELAGDQVLDLPVFDHALCALEREGVLPEVFVHLRPTAPFRRPGWIDEAVALLLAHPEADSVRSVSPPAQHPWRMFSIGPDGMLLPIMRHEHPTPYLPRRQDLPPVYYYNCVIDVTRRATLLGKRSMTGDRMFPFLMATDDAFDIDTRRDLEIAQALLREPR